MEEKGSILGLIAACATTSNVETNKSASFSGPLAKLYVLIDVGDHPTQGGKFGDVLATDLQKDLTKNGIDSKVVSVTGLELSADKYQKEASDFGADQMMAVGLAQGAVSTNNSLVQMSNNDQLTQGVFDVSIASAADNSILWKAKITVKGGGTLVNFSEGGPIDPAKVSEGIIAGMQKDALLPAAPAKN
jgi:hypothetical protein